jgi:hypothetical protein
MLNMCLKGNEMRNANITDIKHIIQLSVDNSTVDNVFTLNTTIFERNLAYAILNQHYHIGVELLKVFTDDNDKIIAYTWANITSMPWTSDKIVNIQMVDIDLSLPPRTRIQLIKTMMKCWEDFANKANANIICSATSRKNQDAFLRLHEKNGYELRGSFAYKKLF